MPILASYCRAVDITCIYADNIKVFYIYFALCSNINRLCIIFFIDIVNALAYIEVIGGGKVPGNKWRCKDMNALDYNRACEREVARYDAQLKRGEITGAEYSEKVMEAVTFYNAMATAAVIVWGDLCNSI